jgi:hypothetical protein
MAAQSHPELVARIVKSKGDEAFEEIQALDHAPFERRQVLDELLSRQLVSHPGPPEPLGAQGIPPRKGRDF